MKRQPRVLAGTALGLLMASAPLGAYPLQGSDAFGPLQHTATPLIPVQSNCAESESAEACAQNQQAEQPRKKKHDQQQQTESAPAEQAAPAKPEQKPRKNKRDQQQQTESAPAEQPAEQAAPANNDQQFKPRKKKRDQQQQTESAPAEQPAEQAAPANNDQQFKPRKKKHDQQQQIEAAPAQQPTEQAAPANDNNPQDNPRKKKHKQDQQIEAAPAEQAAPAQGEQPQDKIKKRGNKPVGEQPVTGEQQPSTGQQPATGEQAAPAQGENPAQGEAAANPNEAPILDSQKDAKRRHRKDKGGQNAGAQNGADQNAGSQTGGQEGNQPEAPKPAPVDQGPPPTDDKTAQQEIKPEKLAPVTEEKGKRVERAADFEDVRRRPRPKGTNVVREFGDRVILQFNNQTIVESSDAPRMHRGARNVYYEDLSGDRTRETVERDNGVQIVTIRNRYGNVIQRSRIAPDGREYVLSYVDERRYHDDGYWRDPGDDLPPMRLTIPREEYILDSQYVEDPDDYYTFLEQPPVERVQRLYSIDEVKRSARVRDIARRVDLDTLNFEFGSASISDSEVQKLDGVANAMEKLLKNNPAETFLIEGHTDAVGTPEANLALSDRRAEAVAEALTNAFGIPPENLTTQGYGEEYLKVDTSGPNRENRRVAIRRITSLVAPVASAD
jgi:outer membrane protein OmpA-like peptidoglycan-associated protein